MDLKSSLLGVLLISCVANAAPHKIELTVETLQLKNGKTVPNGVVRSYDPVSGSVVLLSGRNIVSLQIELLPDDVAARIVTMVPPQSKDEVRSVRDEQRRAAQARQKQRDREAARGAADAANAAAAQQNAREQEKLAARQAKIARDARSLAAARARRYYTYEMKPGSGATVVIRRDVEVDQPESIAGWPDRYRVKGTIGLEYYDSRGNSFNSTIRDFEVIVQGDAQGNAQVVDFSPR